MKIFVADYLPLANKGEEEILRGIETLFKKNGLEHVSFSIFGDVSSIENVDNVTIYPTDICYPKEGSRGKIKYLIGIFFAVLDLIGFYPYRRKIEKQKLLISDLRNSDTILIGHDGFFNIRCAILGNYLHRKGFKYGILGAGFNKPSNKLAWAYNWVYKKTFDNADYVILRERTAYDYVKSISNNKIIELFPDPAFFCPVDNYNKERVGNVLSKYGIENDNGLKIGMTICEDSISFSRAFLGMENKVDAHREFFVKLMSLISNKYNCTFYFLPHCIKEGKGNDLTIAKDIKSRLDKSVDCKIIEDDMPVLDLKYIISRMDFVIGERTHSIINSIATATPFVSLTCSADFRTHDIVGKGCGLPLQVYDMDCPNLTNLYEIIDETIEHSCELVKKLQELSLKHESIKKKFQEII